MSEHLKSPNMREILHPSVTPEMGFQSYELLEGDPEYRKAQQGAFLKGEIRNPTLDYPLIDEPELKSGIAKLNNILSLSRGMDDKTAADAVWDSAGYRMAEMYWLLEVKRLNELALVDPSSDAFMQSAARCQELNEQLYGIPDEELTANVYGEVLAQAKSKKLSLDGMTLLSELSFGTTIKVAGESVKVSGISGEERGRLPENFKDKLRVLAEVLREDFADVFSLVNTYWDEVILPRHEASDDEPVFVVDDMVRLFRTIHESRDPENKSGIGISKVNATALSWDTPTASIKIGEHRTPIDSKTEMIAKIIHEYGHALRMINGVNTELPTLGTGIFSEADEGELSDFLTFEEGFLTLCEMAIDDSSDKWEATHVSRYMAAASAYQRMDYRQAFEMNWRARVLVTLKDGQDVDEKLLAKEKKQAYITVRRFYRSTPTQLVERPVLTFNKDLAYLKGKLVGLQFLEKVGDDKAAIRRIFAGKFDPTNHRQDELVKRYVDDMPQAV